MDGKRTYQIQINGIKESVDAVDALNKKLQELDRRITELSSKSVNVTTKGSAGSSTNSSLREEAALEKEINNLKKEGERLDAKIEAAQTEIYKKVQATKDLYKETISDQKQLAAQERLTANAYSNTMMGMKQRLADLKTMINTTDLGDSDKLKKMTQEANELVNKLKEMEEAYGQFGRNVGNYKSAADGFKSIKVAVGDTVREYDNYRQAVKELRQERFNLSQSVGQEAQAYKDVDKALKTLESDYSDLNKSSKFMDDMLDSMKSLAAIASIGQGLSTLFGIDDSDFNNTMQKLMSLTLILKGIDELQLSIQANDGYFSKSINKIYDAVSTTVDWVNNLSVTKEISKALNQLGEKFVSTWNLMINKLQAFQTELVKSHKFANMLLVGLIDNIGITLNALNLLIRGVYALSKAIASAFKTITTSIGIGVIMMAISSALEWLVDLVKSLKTAETAAQRAAEAVKTLNAQLQTKRDLIASDYLKGAINEEQFLKEMYEAQSKALEKEIELLGIRSAALKKEFNDWSDIFNMFDAVQNIEFTGKQFIKPKTVGHGRMTTFADTNSNDLMITVNSLEEVEEAWQKCNEAIAENQDYLSKWGKDSESIIGRVNNWFNSFFVTVKDTEEVMRGLGNVKLSDFVYQFQEVNKQFAENKISSEQYANELKKLKTEMNDNKVLSSVIANLDKYIPDEKVREAVQNIINEITRLDDAFNMTSPQQIHYWNQVRIEGMKEGWAKTKAQIDENERYEIQQYGKTQEQISLIQAKYAQQRAEALDKANKDAASKGKERQNKLREAEDEYQRLMIELMKNGLAKQIAQLEEEKRQKLRKIKDNGVRVAELSKLTEEVYQKKLYELRKDLAVKTEQIYVEMWNKIYQINHNAQEMDFESQLKELDTHYKKMQDQVAKMVLDVPSTYSPDTSNKRGFINDKRYTEILREEFNVRIANRKQYYAEAEQLDIEKLEKQKAINESAATESMNNELRTLKNGYAAEDKALEDHLKNGELTQEQYKEITERLAKERVDLEANILNKYYVESEAREQKHQEDIRKIKQTSREKELGEYEDFINKLSSIDTSTPVIGWTGLINYSETKKRNNDLIKNYKDTFDKIQAYINNLNAHKSEYDPIEFDKLMTRAKNAQSNIIGVIKNIQENTKISSQELARQIVEMVNMAMQQVQQLMSSLSEITQNQYEAQIEEQEKYIEKYEELLDKQKEATQKYADEVNSIEDELKTARGDRRQQLIDNLNAQMAAERASLAQEKKIEKEKEKAEEKKKKLEHDQAVAKKKMDLAQAYINAAMAVSMAAVNHWPLPAIPMMALAAAAGAAQIAAVASRNIPSYGDGGVILGKSHAQGGVKVLGGRAEVEGGEFITNKQTTLHNVELLDFINSKKKKVNLDDMIEFYTGKSSNVKKIIASASPRQKFADGGQIPMLRNDIELNDRLVNVMEDYANRNVVVSVVDINDRQAAVREVEVLSGLNNE